LSRLLWQKDFHSVAVVTVAFVSLVDGPGIAAVIRDFDGASIPGEEFASPRVNSAGT
jgi:hypothetical protein